MTVSWFLPKEYNASRDNSEHLASLMQIQSKQDSSLAGKCLHVSRACVFKKDG